MENIYHYFIDLEFNNPKESISTCGLSTKKVYPIYGTNNLNLVTCEKCNKIIYAALDYKYLILKGHENISLGLQLSTKRGDLQHMEITRALPDKWHEKEGWIKWGIKGSSVAEINHLKDSILNRINYLGLMEKTFEFSYE